MKKSIVIFFVIFNIFILAGCGNNSSKSGPNANNSNRSQQQSNNSEPKDNSALENQSKPAEKQSDAGNPAPGNNSGENIVTEFSTPIKTKSQNRATNIQITCSKINEMTVAPGEEFSFCDRTGVSTESDGYKKADVIVGKKTKKALGGGNCQVSTTLYNAVLAVPELEVTERHPHGKKVNYVPEGKDAAIAHGSKDLKFKNNSDKTLKIYASSDGKNVVVKLAFLA